MNKLIIGLSIISIGLAILLVYSNQTEQIPSDQTSEQNTFSDSSSTIQLTQPNEEYCHSSYPDVCIPVDSSDLDCDDIEYRNFTVLYPDQHKFDVDKDGIGCED